MSTRSSPKKSYANKSYAKRSGTLDSKSGYIIIFTDGACGSNGKACSYGGMGIHFPNEELKDVSKMYDLVEPCTNQKTELYAILLALKYVNKKIGLSKQSVLIKTDSSYAINCVTKWISGWMNNGWMTKAGKPVLNKELLTDIYHYYKKYNIKFTHVEGHAKGNSADAVGNRIADSLAVQARNNAKINPPKPKSTKSRPNNLAPENSKSKSKHKIINENGYQIELLDAEI
jgi:ribonuclease HI